MSRSGRWRSPRLIRTKTHFAGVPPHPAHHTEATASLSALRNVNNTMELEFGAYMMILEKRSSLSTVFLDGRKDSSRAQNRVRSRNVMPWLIHEGASPNPNINREYYEQMEVKIARKSATVYCRTRTDKGVCDILNGSPPPGPLK